MKGEKTNQQLADRLNGLIQRPEYRGQTWTWHKVAVALQIPVGRSHGLIQWMRRNTTGVVWTVGTYETDYVFMPTTDLLEAAPGIINQWKQARTRDKTMRKMLETLSVVDPDPRQARLASRGVRYVTRIMEAREDFIEDLEDLMAG